MTELPTEVCETKCIDNFKKQFKVEENLRKLKERYNKIIKSFNVTKKGLVEVVYWKVTLPDDKVASQANPDWDFVKNEVEGIIPHQLNVHLNKDGIANPHNIEDNIKD
jgi:hypothetical protein